MDPPDYLPISHLNAYAYCPRRFWYEFVEGEMLVNAAVLAGRLRHGPTDGPAAERQGETLRTRRWPVRSERLRLIGYADVIEFGPDTACPVEHKSGRRGRWRNDQLQLCAQALCLEEMLGRPVPRGYLFYYGDRRREEVPFTPELRAATEATVGAVFALLARGRIPPPLDHWPKCRECSLEPLCLPREVLALTRPGAAAPAETGAGRMADVDPLPD